MNVEITREESFQLRRTLESENIHNEESIKVFNSEKAFDKKWRARKRKEIKLNKTIINKFWGVV